jgi:hypothetical protein
MQRFSGLIHHAHELRRQIDQTWPVVQNGDAARTELLSTEMDNMTALNLTLACWDYDRTRPLIDGRIWSEGIDLAKRHVPAANPDPG